MPFVIPINRLCLIVVILLFFAPHLCANEGEVFFEQKIRPVLVKRCYACHSAAALAKKTLKGGLQLDTRGGLRKGGESGPGIVPGKPENSLLIAAIKYKSFEMPPNGQLPDEAIADFVKWVQIGAPDPREGPSAGGTAIDIDEARKSWAYRTPKMTQVPAVKNTDWPQGTIDRLVLAGLESQGLRPAPAAEKRTLIRRATYDLLGLPPTEDEIDAFLADDDSEAFARVVDRMLNSPDFGIRWARHWLDNVRYAQDDPTCNANNNGTFSIAPYRDWVVKSFREDLPYDQFVRLQVAGDLIPLDDPELINTDGHTATGIWGLAHLVEGNDREKVVADFVDEQLDVLGRTFLGLTVSCARCHDHKFDPITQADYYGLAGIFYSSHIFTFDGTSARTRKRFQRRATTTTAEEARIEPDEKQLEILQKQISALEEKYENPLMLMQVRRDLMTQMMLKPKTANEEASIARRIRELRDKETRLISDREKKGWKENPAELKQLEELMASRDEFRKKLGRFPLRMVMREGPVPGTRHKESGDMPIFVRGDHLSLGKTVHRTIPRVFAVNNEKMEITGSGRLQLAEWLTRPDHPLTARVMANRIWQHLFGRGIVSTPSNYGRLGQPPTHPELLDYLAVRFVKHGCSVKSLIHEVMMSQTYQQSSMTTADSTAHDPDNRWFGRMNRKRLDAESLMDALAWHSDRVKRSAHDAPGWKLALSHRTLFGEFTRDKPQTAIELFDGANPDLLVPARPDSTSATQALFMLNNEIVLNAASKIAEKTVSHSSEQKQRVQFVYRLLFGRPPTAEEQDVAVLILRQSREARNNLTVI
ncbi:MAG: DUF1553 domain-containing protein [Planctomycetaceae bacterium]